MATVRDVKPASPTVPNSSLTPVLEEPSTTQVLLPHTPDRKQIDLEILDESPIISAGDNDLQRNHSFVKALDEVPDEAPDLSDLVHA